LCVVDFVRDVAGSALNQCHAAAERSRREGGTAQPIVAGTCHILTGAGKRRLWTGSVAEQAAYVAIVIPQGLIHHVAIIRRTDGNGAWRRPWRVNGIPRRRMCACVAAIPGACHYREPQFGSVLHALRTHVANCIVAGGLTIQRTELR